MHVHTLRVFAVFSRGAQRGHLGAYHGFVIGLFAFACGPTTSREFPARPVAPIADKYMPSGSSDLGRAGGASGGTVFREWPSGMTLTAGAHGRMALLHITDIHADPFYDISGFGCGYKTATRNLTLQDKKGDAVKDRCGHSKRPVEPSCGPFSGDFIRMENWWRDTVRPGYARLDIFY